MTGGTRVVTVAAGLAVGLMLGSAQPVAAWDWPWWSWSFPTPTPRPAVVVSPDPSPSPTLDPTPAATPAPSPSTSPGPTPSPDASPRPSATPTPTPTPTVPTRAALPAPTAGAAVLTSDSLQISGLRSIAVTTVATAAGPVKVIELVANGSTIGGLDLVAPCAARTQVHTAAGTARATGGLTLDATAIQITVLGIPIILAAADLPDGQLTLPGVTLPPLPTDTVFLSVKMFVLSIQAGAMALDAPRISSAGC